LCISSHHLVTDLAYRKYILMWKLNYCRTTWLYLLLLLLLLWLLNNLDINLIYLTCTLMRLRGGDILMLCSWVLMNVRVNMNMWLLVGLRVRVWNWGLAKGHHWERERSYLNALNWPLENSRILRLSMSLNRSTLRGLRSS